MITIKTFDNEILVQGPYSPQLRDLCHALLPTGYDTELRAWCYPARPEMAVQISDGFLGQDVATDTDFDALVEAGRPPQSYLGIEEDLKQPPLIKTPSWKHQLRAFWTMAEHFGDVERIDERT